MLSLGFPSCCFASPTLAILWLRVSGKRLRITQKNALHLYFLMFSMLKQPISNVYLNIRSNLFKTILFVSFRYYYFELDYIEIYIIEFFYQLASREISKHVNYECKMKTQMKMSRKERKATNYVNISQVILHSSDFIKIYNHCKEESCLYGYFYYFNCCFFYLYYAIRFLYWRVCCYICTKPPRKRRPRSHFVRSYSMKQPGYLFNSWIFFWAQLRK